MNIIILVLLILVISQLSKILITFMRREEDLITEALQTLQQYGPTYQHISDALRAQNPQDFLLHFFAIGERNGENIHKFNSLHFSQQFKIRLTLNLRIKKFINWETTNYTKLFASLETLKKQIDFDINYQLVHEHCPNIFDALHPTLCKSSKNKKLLQQFLQNNMDAFNESQNKETYSSKCYQRLSEEEKQLFQIIAVHTYNSSMPQLLPTEQTETIYAKYAETNSPNVFAVLAKYSPQLQEKVLSSKLVHGEGGWELQSDCKLIKNLDSKTLARCIEGYRFNYRFVLGECFYAQKEEGIYFKYDIALLLKNNKDKESIFNIKEEIGYEKTNQLKQHLHRILRQSMKLITNICETGKKTYFFDGNTVREVNIQTALFFCLKLITYPFRTFQHTVKNDENLWPHFVKTKIVCQIQTKEFKKMLLLFLIMYLDDKISISHDALNNICQIFRWLRQIQKYKNTLNQLLSDQGQNQQKNIASHFIELLRKYLKEKKGQQLPYHLGIWILHFFTLKQSAYSALGKDYSQFCQSLYRFLVQNNKYYKIAPNELCMLVHESDYKLQFYKLLESFLTANPQFIPIISNQWLTDLNNFQTDKAIHQNNKSYRFSLIAIFFIHNSFVATEQIMQTLKKFINNYDFSLFRIKQKYKYIWQEFVNKINLNIAEEISKASSTLVQAAKDEQLFAKFFNCSNSKKEKQKTFDKNAHLLSFFLEIAKTQQITQSNIINLSALMLKLKIMECNFNQEQFSTLSEYSNADLQWIQQMVKNLFDLQATFELSNDIVVIKDTLQKKVTNIVLNNRIVIEQQTFLRSIVEHCNNPYIVYHLLELTLKIISYKSSNESCQLFPQFYNYHSSLIIQVMETLLANNHLQFNKDNDAKEQTNINQYVLRLKKQNKNQKEQFSKLSLKLLQKQFSLLLSYLFSNENWDSNFLINNIRYKQINNSRLFQKSILSDLLQQLTKRFSKQKFDSFYRIFTIIDEAYHRKSTEDLQCQKATYSAIPLPQNPIFVFTKESQYEIYYKNCKQFLNKIFENVLQYQNQKQIEEIYRIIVSQVQGDSKQAIGKQLLKKVMQGLTISLSQGHMQRKKYQRTLFVLNFIQKNIQSSISQLYSVEFVTLYLKQIESDLQSKIINESNVKPFFRFVQRLVPSSLPQFSDPLFDQYVLIIINISHQLFRMIKDTSEEEIQPSIISFIAKIIRFKKPIFNQRIVELFKLIEGLGITSQLFCQLIEDDLRQVSIQLQIKCFFLKQLQKNGSSAKVKVSHFAQVFFQKHKNNKQQFFKVASIITQKTIIEEQNKNITFIMLNEKEQFQYSKILDKKFIQYEYNGIFKDILSSFIENIDKVPQKFQQKMLSLRTIAYNYPILISYILMHPITFEENTIPFIDFLFKKITKENLPLQIYNFFSYMSLDLGLIIKVGDKNIYFCEYIFYRLVRNLMASQLTNRSLLLIYSMVQLKRFAELSLKKIENGKSLCDLLWQRLITASDDSKFKNAQNCLIYAILGFAQRQNSLSTIEEYCQFKKDNNWDQLSSYLNECWLPFQGLICKKQNNSILHAKRQLHLQNKPIYQELDQFFSKWYIKLNAKEEQQIIEAINTDKFMLKNQHLRHVGAVLPNSQQYKDIQSYSTNYIKQHSLFQNFYIDFLQHKLNEKIQQKRKRIKNYRFEMFSNLVFEDDQQQTEENSNEEIQNQFNADRQSRFVPQQFLRAEAKKRQLEENEHFSLGLQKELNVIVEKETQMQIAVNQKLLTSEMQEIFSNINYYLNQLRRQPLTISQIEGKTQEERLQFLKLKQIQTDFDYKQSTMGVEEFQNYCLSNVNKLDRLSSERRNIVRNMQDTMLLKFVQRSVSSDSVDYIIDTIDQNYTLLPNTLQQKHSVGEQQQKIDNKKQKRANYIKQQFLTIQTFQDISDERLYEAILGLYYPCTLLQFQYFIPFLQNKRVQGKVINTLLYIYNNPLENKHFPNKVSRYNLQTLTWDTSQDSQEAIQQLRGRILKAFKDGLTKTFYEAENYLNRIIDFKGIKDIVYSPTVLRQQQSYRPIYEVLQLILDDQTKKMQKNEDYQIQNNFNIFKGVSKIPTTQIIKLLTIFKKIHKISADKSQYEQQQFDEDNIYYRIHKEKLHSIQVNLKYLTKNQQFRQKFRQTFPIHQEGRDSFFVCLFMNSDVYTKEQLCEFHKKVIESDVLSGGNVYFAHKCLEIYSQQKLSQSLWIKKSKKIIPSIIKYWPKSKKYNFKPKQIDRIRAHKHLLNIQIKLQFFYRQILDYQKSINFEGSQQLVAQRKKGIFQSAFLDLRNKPDGFWYQELQVKFMNEHGQIESGYGGGVAKDWYTYVTQGMVNLNYAIFMKTSKNYYFFNRESWINPRHLQFLQFIGKIFALSIIKRDFYLAPRFSILIYKMITGEKIEIEDIIKQFDEGQVINNIQKLRQYHDDSLFCQTFIYEDKRLISNRNLEIIKHNRSKQAFQENLKQKNLYLIKEAVQLKEQKENQYLTQEQRPATMIKVIKIGQSIELVPGGSEILVNMSNREDFIRLTKQKIYDIIVNDVKQQFAAFMVGFKRIVKPDFIKQLTAQELRQIAEGCDKIDIEDLKKYVKLGRGVQKRPQIEWFWSILQKLSQKDRMYLIQHWTGLPKISVEGFRETNLHLVKGQYKKRLFAQTCFNKLHLPECENQQQLEEAIKMAIISVKQGESIIQD